MSVWLLRRVVWGVAVIGIAGMIVTQIGDDQGASIAFGLAAAGAAAGLILVTAVVGPPTEGPDDDLARSIEADVAELVQVGAPEPIVRDLIRKATQMGRLQQQALDEPGQESR